MSESVTLTGEERDEIVRLLVCVRGELIEAGMVHESTDLEQVLAALAREQAGGEAAAPRSHHSDDVAVIAAGCDAGEWELVDSAFVEEINVGDIAKIPMGSLLRVYRRRAREDGR